MHFSRRRDRLATPHHLLHRLERHRPFLGQQHPQRFVHRRLALARRQVQNLHVLLARAARHRFLQGIVRHAEPAGREQVVAVAIARERAGFAHQPVDDVPVIDVLFLPARVAYRLKG